MANLSGQNIGTNYKGILNLGSTINTALSGTLQAITDGDGVASLLQLSTSAVSIGSISGARLAVKGSGNSFATFSLSVQNSDGANLLRIRDDGQVSTDGAISAAGLTGTAYALFGSGAVYDASAVVVMSATNAGFLPPKMTTTQKNAISSPTTGLVVYDTTLNKLAVYTGSAWETVTSV